MSKNKIVRKSVLSPTVLLAGGGGFIGAHIAEVLLEQKVNVVVVDSLNVAGKEIHTEALLKNENFAFFDCDINVGLPQEIESVDYVFHLTGVETYAYANGWGLDTLLANSLGTKNLLDFAQKCEAKFLLVSSIDVYQGLLSSLNLAHYFGKTEYEERKYSLIEAKRYAEALVWEYYKKYDLNTRIVRVPKIYGPRMPLTNTEDLNLAVKDLLDDQNLKLYGEGTEKNYYLYISDAVAGIIKALFNEDTKGKIYSLTATEPYTTLEIIYLLKSIASRELNIEFKQKTGETQHRFVEPDTTNIHELEWEQKVPFKEGVLKTLKWYGYETNEHSFKPNKLIENKNKQKLQETDSILPQTPTPVQTPAVKEETKKAPFKLPFFTKRAKQQETKPPEVKPQEVKPKETTVIIQKQVPRITETAPQKSDGTTRFKRAIGNTLKFTTPVIVIIIAAVIIPLAQTFYFTRHASKQLDSVGTHLLQLNTAKAQSAANRAYVDFQKAQNSLRATSWLFKITGKSETYKAVQNTLGSAENLSKALYFGSKAGEPFYDLWSVLRLDLPNKITPQQLESTNFYVKTAKGNLTLAKAMADEINTEALPKSYQQKIDGYKNSLSIAQGVTSDVEILSRDLVNILGVSEPRKYLILFQNSNELRPTGGFIGSYAVLELENGKVKNLKIDDIYNPDGQLELKDAKTKAPVPITQMLGEETLFIRNANWDPNFKKASQTIRELFYQVDGTEFDGVIALDLEFVKGLLDVTGPVFLTAYNEEITSQNLYQKTQFHSEFNYKDGESQKRSFLTVLGSKLLEKLYALPKEKMPSLFSTITENLTGNHILINLTNSPVNTILEKYNWNGGFAKTSGDYLYVVNANLGGNKANYFIKNDMAYTVSSQTRDGVLRGELTLNYTHTGTDYAWPGGEYKNYIRVFTQQGTKLTGAKLSMYGKDGKLVELKKAEGPKTLEEVESEENAEDVDSEVDAFYADITKNPVDLLKSAGIGRAENYTSFAFLVRVKPNERARLVITYDLPQNLNVRNGTNNYSLYWQKQPGTLADNIEFGFTPPFGKTVHDKIAKKTYGTQFLTKTILDQNKVFSLSF